MIKVGDTVKVIGKTVCGIKEKECIKIGTVCKVVRRNVLTNGYEVFGIVPERELPYDGWGEIWYSEKDLEKGHMEWVRDEDDGSTKTWLISGSDLPTLEIVADSFDAALAEARKIDARYNTGQVKED